MEKERGGEKRGKRGRRTRLLHPGGAGAHQQDLAGPTLPLPVARWWGWRSADGGDTPASGVGVRHEEETSGAPSGECLVSVEPCVASR